MSVSGEFGDGQALVAQLGAMITTDGLEDLLAGFNDAGDASQVESWVGDEQNRSVSAGSVERAIGRTRLQRMAEALGSTSDHVAEALAVIIPSAVDVLTPGGQYPTGAQLDELDLGKLLADNGVDVAQLLGA